MAIDFPSSPNVNDTFTSGSLVYTYDGTKWTAEPAGVSGGTKIEVSNTKAEIIDTGSDGRFVVTTEGSLRMSVYSDGKISIGPRTTTPGELLALETTSGSSLSLGHSGQNRWTFATDTTSLAISDLTGGERMRIDNAGRLLIGTTSFTGFPADSTVRLAVRSSGDCVAFDNAAASGWTLRLRATNNGGTYYLQTFNAASTAVGAITSNGTNTTYGTSSDYRLKENVVSLTGAVDRLNQLRVCRFNFISHPEREVDGFIAHEVQAIVPESITGFKDEINDKGDPVYQNIDQSKLVPLITAALQEALTKIETLETQNSLLQTQNSEILARLDAAGI